MGGSTSMSGRSRNTFLLLAAPMLALAAVLTLSGGGCGGGGPQGKARPDGGPPCQQGTLSCAAGTVCNNGICVKQCASDGTGCPAGQYCEGTEPGRLVCAPIAAAACTIDQDCPLPQ